MSENLREKIINRLRAPLEEYNASFRNLLETGRDIENSLQHGTEMLSEIRHRFDNLSATVELEFEGAAVFDQEIKRMKELLEQTITKVDESLKISNRISEDLQMIAQTFDQIHKEGVQLDDIIKDINTVSESIEVASRNAGITAFHAGKKGRGFEVIAREMTNLVRSSRIPTNLIPVVSKKVIREVVSLGHDLLGVSKFVFELKHINKEFSGITDELLELIPGVEANIKSISDSVTEQKALHNHLLEENQKLSRRIDEIYDTARFSAVLELSLGTVFRTSTTSARHCLRFRIIPILFTSTIHSKSCSPILEKVMIRELKRQLSRTSVKLVDNFLNGLFYNLSLKPITSIR